MSAVVKEVCAELGVEHPEQAADLFVDRLLQEQSICKWPVPLNAVCASLGITTIEELPIACDGMLIPRTDGTYRVILADWAPSSRKRFSLAHEIAHAIVHQLVPQTRGLENRSVFMPLGHDGEERLCDLIASRLLMPRQLMTEFAAVSSFGIGSVIALSRASGASLTSASRRLAEVKGLDVAIVSLGQCTNTGRAVVDRVLGPFQRRKTRIHRGARLKPGYPASRALQERCVEQGWEWLPTSTTQSILRFVQCEGRWSMGGKRRGLLLVADREFSN